MSHTISRNIIDQKKCKLNVKGKIFDTIKGKNELGKCNTKEDWLLIKKIGQKKVKWHLKNAEIICSSSSSSL